MWKSAIIMAFILAASYISPSARTDVPASAQVLLPPGISLHPIDGGTAYYGRFSPSLPDDPGFFPVGVWFESVLSDVDIATDRAAGLNTYVQLTDDSNVDLVKSNGLHAFPSTTKSGSSGFVISDEVDMWGGGGNSNWTGRTQGEGIICDPPDSACGYTIQESLKLQFPRQSLLYANYGKGVTFHLKDSEAAQFVNQYQDVVSADNYWFTDPYICSPVEGGAVFAPGRDLSDEECRTAAHYGWTVDRVRSLVQPAGSKPVWAFVEVGQPFSDPASPPISPAQVRAAVWSSLIHGARGIVYFNHNFGGTCLSQHVLRDECGGDVRPAVTAVNHLITSLAPALNAPSITGLITSGTPGVDMLVKASGGHLYLMAASTRNERRDVAFSLACGSPEQVTVLDEGRTISMSGKTFTDTFDDANAVHVYRFDGGSSCNLGIN
ncbi:hypothetical protein SAMN04489743_0261 [Pseudarthrobacter equi]|uniref:Glycoside hydrolase family 42 N-terminal domain-containing protein n=2 Tax=Pseudarthrobacter equi TaxID=728066 RepID=A0A1H1SXF4_9MICC|nr:hypothetical protein SAMN04489743_0261 [Pseudarthrobacter equi]